MRKAPKIIVLIFSLALVAGLFIFLLNFKTQEPLNSNAFKVSDETVLTKNEEKIENIQKNISSKTSISSENLQKKFEENDTPKAETKTIPIEPKEGWTQANLAEEISKTVTLSDKNGEVKISYAQPEIPPKYHFTFKVEIFDETGKTIDRYISDAGWASDISNYDPSEKVQEIIMRVQSMAGKMGIILIKVGDSTLSESANVYQLTINYDESWTWNNAVMK